MVTSADVRVLPAADVSPLLPWLLALMYVCTPFFSWLLVLCYQRCVCLTLLSGITINSDHLTPKPAVNRPECEGGRHGHQSY